MKTATQSMLNEAGLTRAAILLMSLPNRSAALVLAKLPQHFIEAISIRIAQTDSIGGDEQEVVMALSLSPTIASNPGRTTMS